MWFTGFCVKHNVAWNTIPNRLLLLHTFLLWHIVHHSLERVFLLRIINYVPFTTRCSLRMEEIIIKINQYISTLSSLCSRRIEWSETHKCADWELLCKAAVLNFIVQLSNFSSTRHGREREKSSFHARDNRMFKRLFSFFFLSFSFRQLSTPDLEHFFMLIVIIIFIDHLRCLDCNSYDVNRHRELSLCCAT